MTRISTIAAILAARNRAVPPVDYNRDWRFAEYAAVNGNVNFGPWAAIFGTSSTTATRWNSAGVLEVVPQYSKRVTWNPATGQCMGLVVEALNATDLADSAALNVAVTSAQTKTLTAGNWTVSFTGTGSVTLSGVATGTIQGLGAERQAFHVFTASAGSLTVTPSGQVRNLDIVGGRWCGMPIVGGSARAVEAYNITGTDFSNFWPSGNSGSVFFEWFDLGVNNDDSADLWIANTNHSFNPSSLGLYFNGGDTGVNMWSRIGGVNGPILTCTPRFYRSRNRAIVSWGPSGGIRFSLNGCPVSTAALPSPWVTPNMLRMGNGLISGAAKHIAARLWCYSTETSEAACRSMTEPQVTEFLPEGTLDSSAGWGFDSGKTVFSGGVATCTNIAAGTTILQRASFQPPVGGYRIRLTVSGMVSGPITGIAYMNDDQATFTIQNGICECFIYSSRQTGSGLLFRPSSAAFSGVVEHVSVASIN